MDPEPSDIAPPEFEAFVAEYRGIEVYSEGQKRDFADRIETALDGASDQYSTRLHLLCAHLLGTLKPRPDRGLLDRILQHLNAIHLDSKMPNYQQIRKQCSELKAKAWSHFGDESDPSYFELALPAFENALVDLLKDGQPLKIGTLEYNTARLLFDAYTNKKDTNQLERAEQHMRRAVEAYLRTSDRDRQGDAKHFLESDSACETGGWPTGKE